MSLNDHSSRLLPLALGSTFLFVGRPFADDAETAFRAEPQTITAASRSEEVIGNETVRRAYVEHGTNRFAFVVPQGFRIDNGNPEKVVLTKSDYSCYFTFRLIGPSPALVRELKPEAYRKLALDQHAGAAVVDESAATAAGHSGPAFDLQWKPPGACAQSARLAFIPSPAGVLEFSVVAGTDKFQDARQSFNLVLLNFRSNEGGKLEIPRHTDQS